MVKHSLPIKAALELPYIQNHITFAKAESRLFESFVCKLETAAALPPYNQERI